MSATILLAEDDFSFGSFLYSVLQANGYVVWWERDGAKAVARLEHVRPDLVILDVKMPKKDGFEVAQRVRETPGLDRVPILFLTASGEDETAWGAKAAAKRDSIFVHKPIPIKTLLGMVRTVLERRRAT